MKGDASDIGRRVSLAASVVRGAAAAFVFVLFGSGVAILLNARRAAGRSTMPQAPALAERSASPGGVVPREPAPSRAGTREGSPELAPADRQFAGVAIRLVDELGKAKLEIPSWGDRQVRAQLSKHWRRHYAPFTGPGGELGHFVQSVGLQRNGTAPTSETKSQLDSTAGGRGSVRTKPPDRVSAISATGAKPQRASAPLLGSQDANPVGANQQEESQRRERDTRTFGLGEGSIDQRECIVAPTPATLRFPLHIPKDARMRVAPALLGETEATFVVAFRPRLGGERRVLGTKTLRGPSRRFEDWTIDLEAAGVSGFDGELELTTQSKHRDIALTLWGSPIVTAPRASRLPYNVLFIIVDAMRSDAIAASHDPAQDALRLAAKRPPLDAWFPAMSEVAPTLDRLAANGAIWAQAWSAAMWTRPATLSILTGMRASHTGIDVLGLELLGDQRRNFYAKRPPLLPLTLRAAGAATAAFVNNMYLSGSLGVGIDFAFETLVDHRMQALDTRAITRDALQFLTDRGQERFLLLLNYASPHAPYLPPPRDLRAVRKAVNRPADLTVQNYLGEVHKDDAAIGEVLRRLEELNLTEKTLVIVTADHGETMSAAHDWVAIDVAQGVPSGRFTHLSTMWEEAARVAMLMSLPGKIPAGRRFDTRVQTIDLLPTVLELEGLELPQGIDGRSLVPLFAGQSLEPRPVVIEGRGARSLIDGNYHFIVRDPVARRLRHRDEEFERSVELYDLVADPGERHDIAPQHSELVAGLRAKIAATITERPAATRDTHQQQLHFRFATGGKAGQLEFVLNAHGASVKMLPVGIDARLVSTGESGWRLRTMSNGERAVGFDLIFGGSSAAPTWDATLDGKPWPAELVFAGALGQRASGLVHGFNGGAANGFEELLTSSMLPHIVAAAEVGMFITRDPMESASEIETDPEAQLEAQQAMQAWGYAKKPASSHP